MSEATEPTVRMPHNPIHAANARELSSACKRMVKGEDIRSELLSDGWKKDHVLLVEQLSGLSVNEFVMGITGELRAELLGWLDRLKEARDEMPPQYIAKCLDTILKSMTVMTDLQERSLKGKVEEAKDVSPVSKDEVMGVLTGKGSDDKEAGSS